MNKTDIRTNGQQIEHSHRSARGKIKRNSSTFTRGSQLLVHEYLMTFSGIKIPFTIWFFTFIIFAILLLSLMMNQHENHLIIIRGMSAIWDAFGFSQDKLVNLTLADGSTHQIRMLDVALHHEVIVAWNKFLSAMQGAFLMSLCFGVPLGWWFVSASRKRGSNILEERHERGAFLVEDTMLQREVRNYNVGHLRDQLGKTEPTIPIAEYEAMTAKERCDLGLHQPYNIAGIQYPWRTEQSHTMLIGTTGTGKTTILREYVRQLRERGHRAVIFDLTGAYVENFFNPETDTILNPMDDRCPKWSLFTDCENFSEFHSAACAMIPSGSDGADPFWPTAARTLLIEFCLALVEEGNATNHALAMQLMFADLATVNQKVTDTVAEPLTSGDAAKMAQSIRAVLNTNGESLLLLPDEGPEFSIKKWISREDNPGSILFITSNYTELGTNRSLLTLWNDIAVNALMKLPQTRDIRTWFFFDEVNALHKLPAIEAGMQTARARGGAFILGMHSFAKLAQTYGEEGAVALSSLARTKVILASADRETAEFCSQQIGSREVWQMDEGYTYGNNPTRDASTLTPRKAVEELVLPDDITNLPALQAYVKFPEGFPAAHVKFPYKPYPNIAEGYVPTKRKRLTARDIRAKSEEGTNSTSEGGGPEMLQRSESEQRRALETLPLALDRQDRANSDLEFVTSKDEASRPQQGSLNFLDNDENRNQSATRSANGTAGSAPNTMGYSPLKSGGASAANQTRLNSQEEAEQAALRAQAKREAMAPKDDTMRREILSGAVAQAEIEEPENDTDMGMD